MTARRPSLTLRTTVCTLAVLAALAFSHDANAEWARRAGGGGQAHAWSGAGARTMNNEAPRAGTWRLQEGSNLAPAARENDGEGWRAKLQEKQGEGAAAAPNAEERAARQQAWRERLQQNGAAGTAGAGAAAGSEERAARQQAWRERWQGGKPAAAAANGEAAAAGEKPAASGWKERWAQRRAGGASNAAPAPAAAAAEGASPTVTTATQVTGQNGHQWNSSTTYDPANHHTEHENNLGQWEVTGTGGPSGTREGTYSTNAGGSGTIEQSYERGGGSSTRNTTVTNQNGQSASWNTQQNVTHSNGTVTTSTQVTGQNGNTYNSSTSYNAATHTTTHTGNNGGGWEVTGTGGPSGTRTGTYTTGAGKTGTIEQTYERENGTSTRNTTVTNQNGQSASWTTQQSVTVNRPATGEAVKTAAAAPAQPVGGTVLMTVKIPPATPEPAAAPAATPAAAPAATVKTVPATATN